jgi:hypothetical protein
MNEDKNEGKEMILPSASKRAARGRRLAATALGIGIALCANSPSSALPTLDQLMADFAFSPDDVQRVRNGELVKATAKETSNEEIAVVMVFLVKSPAKTLISFFEAGGGFRNDPQVKAVAEISSEGAVDDFKAAVRNLGESEAKRYLEAKPGDRLNLSTSEIAAFQALNAGGGAGQAQVEAELSRLLLARYQAYRARGLAGIAPYARGKSKETQPAEALHRATEAATGIKKYVPAFYDVLLNYPQGAVVGLDQGFFCMRYAMSGRPTFTLRHRLAMPVGDAYVAVDREFYVSHDYNEMQAVGGLLPVEGGTAVVYLNRVTTAQLDGFAVSAKQAVGRAMMANQISEIFEKSRAGFGAN